MLVVVAGIEARGTSIDKQVLDEFGACAGLFPGGEERSFALKSSARLLVYHDKSGVVCRCVCWACGRGWCEWLRLGLNDDAHAAFAPDFPARCVGFDVKCKSGDVGELFDVVEVLLVFVKGAHGREVRIAKGAFEFSLAVHRECAPRDCTGRQQAPFVPFGMPNMVVLGQAIAFEVCDIASLSGLGAKGVDGSLVVELKKAFGDGKALPNEHLALLGGKGEEQKASFLLDEMLPDALGAFLKAGLFCLFFAKGISFHCAPFVGGPGKESQDATDDKQRAKAFPPF
jgi:hypothetical protein